MTGDTLNTLRVMRDAAGPGETARGHEGCLVLLSGNELGRRFRLTHGETTVGRDPTCQIVIESAAVSRIHAKLIRSGVVYVVQDCGSTNGSFVNDELLRTPRIVKNGDILRLGDTALKYLDGDDVELAYHAEVHRLATLDPLTGVANKRHVQEILARSFRRAVRHERPLSLLVFDIDHFKAINDQWGHLAGDRILCDLATAVSQRIRRDEVLARYGGEEFLVVMPESGLPQALVLAEAIRALVETGPFTFGETRIPVTVSVGAAALRADHMATPDDLLNAADRAMYAAKAAGRNCVAADDPPPHAPPPSGEA